MTALDNVYNVENWSATGHMVGSDIAQNTACRAPGFAPATFFMESIIEHVAFELGVDAYTVRKLNLYNQGDTTPFGQKLLNYTLPSVLDALENSSDYKERATAVTKFNQENRWVKRGLSVLPHKYGVVVVV